MGSKSLKIYPSGFLGNPEVSLTQPLDLTTIKQRLFEKLPTNFVDNLSANREVESLWDDVVFGDPAYKSFEFREKILKVALRAFGTRSIFEWIAAQADSDMYTEYHHLWIDETLQYALEGKPRTYTYSAWFALFSCGSSDKSSLISPTVRRHFGTDGSRDFSINDFLVAWVSQPRGIDDLIESLHILFGKR